MLEVLTTSTVRSMIERPVRGSTSAGELAQHLGHLVAALAAADVDDDVGVGVLGERLLDHRLAGAEAAGHRHRAALGHREQQVEDALPGDERPVVRQPGADGPRPAHRPVVRQVQRRAVGQPSDGVRHRELAGIELRDAAAHAGRHEDAVLQRSAFDHGAEHVASLHLVPRLASRLEVPARGGIERRRARARLHEVAGQLGQPLERPADAVEDGAEQAGAELEGERPPAASTGSPSASPVVSS